MKTLDRTQDTGALRIAQSVFVAFADDKAVHGEFTLRTAVLAALGRNGWRATRRFELRLNLGLEVYYDN